MGDHPLRTHCGVEKCALALHGVCVCVSASVCMRADVCRRVSHVRAVHVLRVGEGGKEEEEERRGGR